MGDLYNKLLKSIQEIEIIDTHEHLPYLEKKRDYDTDILKEYLSQYFGCDLISAGLDWSDYQKAINNNLPLKERWEVIEPYWEIARYTGYGRALDITVKELYNIDKICSDTIEDLNEAFQKTLNTGHYQKVLKEKSKIKVSLLDNLMDNNLNCDQKFFKSVFRLDRFISPKNGEHIANIEKESSIRITSFEDWLEACQKMFYKSLEQGAVALKSALAYERSLKYEIVTKSEAEEEFNNIFSDKHFYDWEDHAMVLTGIKFQNYMMHYILRMANSNNLTFQFHTGLQDGYGNIITNSDPSLLSNLFLQYPDVDFDIFHIGYPYQHVVSALAKNFPNVFIDMCWAHIISPTAATRALEEWIEAVPINKISAFGGDYSIIDPVYGHQYIARENVCKALVQKVKMGLFKIDKAYEIAQKLFYDNPLKIFKLKDKLN